MTAHASWLDTPADNVQEPDPLPQIVYDLKVSGVFLPKEDDEFQKIRIKLRPIAAVDAGDLELPEDLRARQVGKDFFVDGQQGKFDAVQFLRKMLGEGAKRTDGTYKTVAEMAQDAKGMTIRGRVKTRVYTRRDGSISRENELAAIVTKSEDAVAALG